MSEKDYSKEFCLLTKRLHPVRIENSLFTPGLPDVSIAPGFVELKWLKAYPKRPETPVRIDHYTEEQKLWLRTRYAAGGGAWLSLKVRSDRYIFDADGAQMVGQLNKAELLEACIAHWPCLPPADEFCRVFTGLP